jgi:hypothetical protein
VSRSITVALGVAVALAGLAFSFVPGLATFLPLGDIFVFGFGVVLVLGATQSFYGRWQRDPEYGEFEDREASIELPRPGDEFDAELGSLGISRAARSRRRHFRDQVTAVAVETLQRHYAISGEEAEDRLDDGTWTDDPFAAAYFSGTLEEVPTGKRVREMLRRESAYQHRCKRAVGELHALLEDTDE